MDFALCPKNGLPRLWRFVGAEALPVGVLATLDVAQNLLIINREVFDRMFYSDRNMLLKTRNPVTEYIDDMGAVTPFNPEHRVRVQRG